jgi:hypothetical protein
MKSLVSKISRLVTQLPTLVTFGIVVGITVAVGAAVGMLDHQQVLASNIMDGNSLAGLSP